MVEFILISVESTNVFTSKLKLAVRSQNTQLWQGGCLHEANDWDYGVGSRDQHRGVGVERILASGTREYSLDAMFVGAV